MFYYYNTKVIREQNHFIIHISVLVRDTEHQTRLRSNNILCASDSWLKVRALGKAPLKRLSDLTKIDLDSKE